MADHTDEARCIQLTANIVSAYVSNNTVSSAEIPALISQVYSSPTGSAVGARAKAPLWAYCRANTRITCVAFHAPPRAVGIPRSFNPAARARSDVAPAARSSAMMGARSAALPEAIAAQCVRQQLRYLCAGFDFDILFGQLPATAVEEILDGLALSFNSEATLALPARRNP